MLLTLVYQEGGIYFVKKKHVSSLKYCCSKLLTMKPYKAIHKFETIQKENLSFELDYYGIHMAKHVMS